MAGYTSNYPSVWSIISGNIGNILEIAFNQTVTDFVRDGLNLQDFKSSVLSLLSLPFSKIPAGHLMGQGNQTVNADINATVYQAVYKTMGALNMSGGSNVSFGDAFATRLTVDIEMEVFNEILRNATNAENSDGFGDFFHNLPLKDETLFVALVCMAVIVPIIFITLFFIFFYKRRQENREKSQEMLLREQPETAMEDYKGDTQMGEEPPDLDLKMAPV